MKDYSVSLTNTDGSAFPNTKAVNASSPTATDGTEYVKVLIDDYWGANQALMRDAGLTPDGSDEIATASQRQEAIRFLIQNKAWNAYYNGTNWIYIANGKAFRFVIDDANERVRFDSAISGTAGNPITWVNGPYIDENGFVGAIDSPFLHVQNQQTSGTGGGAATTGSWQTVTLNTEVTNTITGASLSANVVTLPAGGYFIRASQPFFAVDRAAIRVYNNSDASEILVPQSGYNNRSAGTDNGGWRSWVYGRFTLAATKNIIVQYQAQTNSGSGALGLANGSAFSVTHEVYGDVEITKIG